VRERRPTTPRPLGRALFFFVSTGSCALPPSPLPCPLTKHASRLEEGVIAQIVVQQGAQDGFQAAGQLVPRAAPGPGNEGRADVQLGQQAADGGGGGAAASGGCVGVCEGGVCVRGGVCGFGAGVTAACRCSRGLGAHARTPRGRPLFFLSHFWSGAVSALSHPPTYTTRRRRQTGLGPQRRTRGGGGRGGTLCGRRDERKKVGERGSMEWKKSRETEKSFA